MTNTKYNGWTNYATWRVNLEIFDSLGPEEFDLERGEELKLTDVFELSDAMRGRAEYYICEQGTGLAQTYALVFLEDVNWYEIAEHFIETYSE